MDFICHVYQKAKLDDWGIWENCWTGKSTKVNYFFAFSSQMILNYMFIYSMLIVNKHSKVEKDKLLSI